MDKWFDAAGEWFVNVGQWLIHQEWFLSLIGAGICVMFVIALFSDD